jgi:O-antigen ligase/tetratricopeptide (TPR) repeat protein
VYVGFNRHFGIDWMAKRRSVNRGSGKVAAADASDFVAAARSSEPFFTPASLLGLSAAIVTAALVYAGYWPSDSIDVQTGGARYLVGWLLVAATIAMLVRIPTTVEDWVIDALAFGVAAWMIVSTLANAENSNIRLAVNELWWWIAAAGLLSATRRWITSAAIVQALLYVVVGVCVGVAVFGWYQLLISFPALFARYELEPDVVLREAGIVAEVGSAERVVFENRLYGGGPTGTFALANSMAALLVGGSIVMVGLCGQQWSRSPLLHRLIWAAAILVTLGMLAASRSRSALASLLIIAVASLCLSLARRRTWLIGERWQSHRGLFAGVLGAVAGAAGLVAVMLWRIGSQSEWLVQAPASLAIRMNYWRACAQMVAHSPLSGVGPGQFKARYEAFRATEAMEQIADPHNWLWQTLTTGGVPSGILLLGLAAVIFWRFCHDSGTRPLRGANGSSHSNLQDQQSTQPLTPSLTSLTFSTRWIYAGAGVAVVAIWIGGAAIGFLPEFDAAAVATAVAIAFVVSVVWQGDDKAIITGRRLNVLAAWALAAMMINLLAAGGLIIPGIAVTLWILAAIMAPFSAASPANAAQTSDAALNPRRTALSRWMIGAIAAVVFLSWYVTAILPVDQAAAAMGRFETAWSQRRYGEAELALREAVRADRWDPQPPLHLAQVLMQQALFAPDDRRRWEARWHEVEAETLARAGKDPVTTRVLADVRLWHYQRYGESAALQRAAELYRDAVERSPSHQTYAAQLAEIYRQLGDPRATRMAERALALSQAGGYYERTLPYTMILPAEQLNDAALDGPVRRPASEALATLLDSSN